LLTVVVLLAGDRSIHARPEADDAGQDPATEAAARLRRGIELFSDEKYEEAIVELTESLRLSPRARVLYLLGKAYNELNRPARAREALEQYLDSGEEISKERKAEVERLVEQLRERTAELRITANVEGAQVTIDGEAVGFTPLSGVQLVDVGTRRVAATKRGHVVAKKSVDVAVGETADVELELSLEPTAVQDTQPSEPADGAEVKNQSALIAIWVTAAVLAAGGAGMGVLIWSGERTATRLRAIASTPPDDIQAIETRNTALSITTGVLAGLAVTLAGVGLYLTLWEEGDGSDRAARLEVDLSGAAFEARF
jgi:tetratricopeptide (TPR) repeat protein